MIGKRYELRILPLFEDDLNEIVDYITYRLRNPIAAESWWMMWKRPLRSGGAARRLLNRTPHPANESTRITASRYAILRFSMSS